MEIDAEYGEVVRGWASWQQAKSQGHDLTAWAESALTCVFDTL